MSTLAEQLEAKGMTLPTIANHHTTPIVLHAPQEAGKISLDATTDQMFSLFWLDKDSRVRRGYLYLVKFVLAKGRIHPGAMLQVTLKKFVCDACAANEQRGLEAEPDKMVPSCVANWDFKKRSEQAEKQGKPLEAIPTRLTCKCCKNPIRMVDDGNHLPSTPEGMKEQLLESMGRPHNDEVVPEVFVVMLNGHGPSWEPTTELAYNLNNRWAQYGRHIVPYGMVHGTSVPGATNVVVTAQPVMAGAVRESLLYRDDHRLPDSPDFRPYKTQILLGKPPTRDNEF